MAPAELRMTKSTGPRRFLSFRAVLLTVAVVGVGLGFLGFTAKFPPRGEASAFVADNLNNLWRSLALLRMEGEPGDDDGWPLVIARYLAPAATVAFFYSVFGRFMKWRMQGRLDAMVHPTVIIGLGARGRAFAKSRDGEVAGLDLDPTASIENDRHHQVAWMVGDGREAGALDKVGVRRASHVLILTGSDAVNLEILQKVTLCCAGRAHGPKIWVRLRNRLLARQLDREDDFARGALSGKTQQMSPDAVPEVQPFDAERVAAQQLLRAHPLVDLADLRGQQRVHAVVIGWTGFAFAFIEQLARLAPYKDFKVPRVDLVVRRRDEVKTALAALQPAFHVQIAPNNEVDQPPLLKLTLHALDDESGVPTLGQMEEIEPGNDASVTAIVVTLGSDEASAAAAMTLRERCGIVGRWHAPIFVEINGNSSLTSLLQRRAALPDPADQIVPIAAIDETCRLDGLLEDDKAASAFHKAYLKSPRAGGAQPGADDSSRRPWSKLGQTYRLANRRAVDHLPIKLLSAGFHVSGFPLHAAGGAIDLDPDEAGQLAALEHRSWEIDRLLDGWRPGRARDNRRRINEAIGIPYEKLGRSVQRFDQDQIATALRMLATPGHPTVRREFRLGLLGHNYVSHSDRSAIVAALDRELPKLFPKGYQGFVSLFTPLAPGADLILTQKVAGWLTEQKVPYRVVVVRAVPYEIVLSAFLPQLERQGTWKLEDARLADDPNERRAMISREVDDFLAENSENIVVNLLPPALTMHDWHVDPARCQSGYRSANACLVLRCDALLAFYDPRRTPPGTKPAAGGTAEALTDWAPDLSAIPEEYARPWRRANQKSPQIVVVP